MFEFEFERERERNPSFAYVFSGVQSIGLEVSLSVFLSTSHSRSFIVSIQSMDLLLVVLFLLL